MTQTEIFDRDARLVVGDLEVSELRTVFRVSTDIAQEPNDCEVIILNLSPDHRAQIAEYNAEKGANRTVPVSIEAGYKSLGGAQLIYAGQLRTTVSFKDRANWVTTLSSGDGELSTRIARLSQTFPSGVNAYEVINGILDAVGLGLGNLAEYKSDLSKVLEPSITLSGSAAYALNNWTRANGLRWSIQNNTPQFYKINEPATTLATELTPDTGLIGSPTIDANGKLNATARLLPSLRVGSVVVVKSATVSGQFKIDRAKYDGDTRGPTWQVSIEASKY